MIRTLIFGQAKEATFTTAAKKKFYEQTNVEQIGMLFIPFRPFALFLGKKGNSEGATTFSVATYSPMTLSITALSVMALRTMTLSITFVCYAECCYAKCCLC